MIQKVKGEYVAECDNCGEEFAGGCTEEWGDFIQQLKDAGWAIQKSEDQWEHFCPECKL